MQKFEIDVSGHDLLSKDYVICIANKNGIIKGFKFDENLIYSLCNKYNQDLYKYKKSKKGKSLFKVRLYSIVIYYLFRSVNVEGELSLKICKDFDGRENDIKENLRFFLGKKLSLSIGDRIYFTKLDKDSIADRYSFLMRKDKKDKMNTYILLRLEYLEKWLK